MGPRVRLSPVREEHKAVLANLLQLYRYDFSPIRGFELTPHGTYVYPYLDHYFVEPGREPFFILVDDRLAGFALARRHDGGCEVAEFFVVRRHRRRGVGRAAASQLLRRFPGGWTLAFDHANEAAARFWPDVVRSVAAGPVESVDRYPPEVSFASTWLWFRVPDGPDPSPDQRQRSAPA